MNRKDPVILTNRCMVYDGSRVLAEEKVFWTELSELFPDSVGNRKEILR